VASLHPRRQHAQAADISTVGLGGASARSVFGPYAAKVGLSSRSHPSRGTSSRLKAYPSPRSLSATVLQAALARHGEWIVLPGAAPAPTLKQIQGALGDFQTSHLGSSDLIVGAHTKAALAVEPRNCPICKRLGRYPYK
jgi:hypothetical protein